jgi:tRNA G18 (ribose-2'-O)-methylase SpoU
VGPVVEVSDPDDPRLADYRSLTDVSLRTSFEPPHGLFIAESALVIERAIAAGYRLRSAVMTPSWLDRTAPALAGSDAPVYLASDAVLRGLTGFHVHRGALASVHRRPLPDLVDLLAEARRVTVIEDVVSHTNLGAIFRTAAAFGIDGVVISPQAADPLYRRSVRVSMGGVFAVPFARATSWPGDLERIRAAGFTVVALTPAADSVSLREFRPPAGQRIALLVGTEGAGLSRAAIDASDVPVRIPMAAGVDSLNVATAAAITFAHLHE